MDLDKDFGRIKQLLLLKDEEYFHRELWRRKKLCPWIDENSLFIEQ
jgi:hypothetical protein